MPSVVVDLDCFHYFSSSSFWVTQLLKKTESSEGLLFFLFFFFFLNKFNSYLTIYTICMLSFFKLIKYSRDFFLLGIKHLQTPPNVFVQLPARVNVTIVLWTALNIVVSLNLSFLKYNLYNFLYLKSFLLFKIR